MQILDIVACPACRGGLRPEGQELGCTGCGRSYPVVEGAPVLLPGAIPSMPYEEELEQWQGYTPWVQEIFDSLAPDHVALDLGCGNRHTADPRIVLLDVIPGPCADLVGDAHALPFKDGVFDFIYATAVFEHLRRPFVAAGEIHRVLRPGGNVLVDCAFVFPFHGYPAVYFNASIEGMRQLFADFTEIGSGVAPWQMPSFSLDALLGAYLRFFRPQTPREKAFADLLRQVRTAPLGDFDSRFREEDAARLAAAVTYMGMKPAEDGRGIVPAVIQEVHDRNRSLQERYPQPGALASFEIARQTGHADSLMRWALGEGRAHHHEIERDLAARSPLDKRWPWG